MRASLVRTLFFHKDGVTHSRQTLVTSSIDSIDNTGDPAGSGLAEWHPAADLVWMLSFQCLMAWESIIPLLQEKQETK